MIVFDRIHRPGPSVAIDRRFLRLCAACEEEVADVCFRPCGHAQLCHKCSRNWRVCVIGGCGRTIEERRMLQLRHTKAEDKDEDKDEGEEEEEEEGSAEERNDSSSSGSTSAGRKERRKEREEVKLILTKELRKMAELRREWEEEKLCALCSERPKDVVFNCGHVSCAECARRLAQCHTCRQNIVAKWKFFYS